ncbi:MAG: arginase [Bacteroidota bacterium]
MKDNLTIIYNRSELGAGTRGASLGIDAMIAVALTRLNNFFKETNSVSIQDKNHVLAEVSIHDWAKHIDSIIDVYEDVCKKVNEIIAKDCFPLIISGDHASSGGTIAGIKKAHPEKRLGIIWIDAHADLHSPYTSPSGNVHGMPVAAVLNEDNIKFDPGDVRDETKVLWEKLKSVGGIKPKVLPEDVVFIGVRDTEKEEDYLIEKHSIPNYSPKILREKGIENVISEIKNKLIDCDIIYVSFDVDSMDSDVVSSGTGTPVANGLTDNEAKELLHTLMQWDKVAALEITEINPLLDNKGNKMAETALDILEYALGR